MQNLRFLVVVAGLCAPLLAAQAPKPPSTWPALFPGEKDTPANDATWDEAQAGAGGVTFRVPHPKTWTVRISKNPVMTILSPDGKHFAQISEPLPLPKPMPLPFAASQIRQTSESLSKVIGLHDFRGVGGGQALAGGRWWLWQDQIMPTGVAAPRLPAEVRDVLSAEIDSLRLWVFITDVNSNATMVFCWALVPRGLSEAEIEKDLRPATAVFARMIKRMVLQKSASDVTRSR
jgi:hypothetical protein